MNADAMREARKIAERNHEWCLEDYDEYGEVLEHTTTDAYVFRDAVPPYKWSAVTHNGHILPDDFNTAREAVEALGFDLSAQE